MKVLILGDVSPTKETNPLFHKKDIAGLFHDTGKLFNGNDVNFVNLECALTEKEDCIEKFGPPLKACAETAECLQNIGVNVCGLSNNHIFDYGIKGVCDTINALNKSGIMYTGFGDNYEDSRKNLVVEKNGEKLCFIAVCEHEYSYALNNRMGSRPFDEYDTMDDIRDAKKNADKVIVIYHGGKEHCRYPSPRLRKLCRSMVKNGANIVVCQHSHCIGCYEEFEGGHILYGQGNFHFVNPNGSDEWNECLALTYDTESNKIKFTPVVSKESGIEIAKGERATQILSDFKSRCVKLENGEWEKLWHEFCESLREPYTRAAHSISGKFGNDITNTMFAHYLDCEAHLDVWHELFYTANKTNELK